MLICGSPYFSGSRSGKVSKTRLIKIVPACDKPILYTIFVDHQRPPIKFPSNEGPADCGKSFRFSFLFDILETTPEGIAEMVSDTEAIILDVSETL